MNQQTANKCFACGPDNREGLQLRFDYDDRKKRAETQLKIQPRYQGATGYAHGGIIATLLDEAMAKVNGKSGVRAVTLKLTVSYRKMVPLEAELTLIGWRTARRGRKLYLRAELRDRRALLADATGLFLVI